MKSSELLFILGWVLIAPHMNVVFGVGLAAVAFVVCIVMASIDK